MKNKIGILTLISILIMALVVFLALPYPFNPLSIWIEHFLRKTINCQCLCPWWLFALLQICGSLVLLSSIKTEIKPLRSKYLMLLAFLGFGIFIFHMIAHNYFIAHARFEASIFCPWFWLIDLILIIIFGILKIRRKEK